MTVNELRTKRATLWNTMEGFLDTHRTDKGVLSVEDDATYNNMLFYRLIAVVFFTLLNPIYDITQNIDSFLLILVLQIIWVLSHNLQVNNRQVNLPVPSIIIVFNRCYCIYNTNGIDPV